MSNSVKVTDEIRKSWHKIIMNPTMWRNWSETVEYIHNEFIGEYAAEFVDSEGVLYIQNNVDAVKLKLIWT